MWQYAALSACLFSMKVSADGHLEHRKWYAEGSKTVGSDMYLQYGELFESPLYDGYSVATNDTVKYLPVFQYFFRRKLQCEGAPKLWDHDTRWEQSTMNCYANKLDVGGAKRTWGKKCKWKVCMHCPQCLEPCTDQTAQFKVTKRACLCVEDKTEDFFAEPLFDETGLKYVASIPRLEKTCLTNDYCNNSLNNNVDGYCYQPFAPTPAPPTPTPPTPTPPTPTPPTPTPPTPEPPAPPTPDPTPAPTLPPVPKGICYLAAPGIHACNASYVSPHVDHCEAWVSAFTKSSGKVMGRPLQTTASRRRFHEHYAEDALQGGTAHCQDGAWGAAPGGCSVQSGLDWTAHYKYPVPGKPIEDATEPGCVSTDYQLVCCEIQEFWFNETEEYREETGMMGIYLEQSVRRRWATYVDETDRRRKAFNGNEDMSSWSPYLPFNKTSDLNEVERIIYAGWRGSEEGTKYTQPGSKYLPKASEKYVWSHGAEYGKDKFSERNRKDLMPGQQEKCAAIAQNLFGHELYLINDASAQPGCLLSHIIDGEEARKYIHMDMPRSYDGFAFLIASLAEEFSGVNSRYGVVFNLIGEAEGGIYNDNPGLGMVPVCEKGTCDHWCESHRYKWSHKCGWASCAECDACLQAEYVLGDYNTGVCPPTAWKLEKASMCRDAANYLDVAYDKDFHKADNPDFNKRYPAGCYQDIIDGNPLNPVIRFNAYGYGFEGPGHVRPTTKAVCQREEPYKVGDCVMVPLSGKTSPGKITKYVKHAEWEILFEDGSHGCHEGTMLQHSTACSEDLCRDTCYDPTKLKGKPWSVKCTWTMCKACDRCVMHGPPTVFKSLGDGVCVDGLERMPDMYYKVWNFDSAEEEKELSSMGGLPFTEYKEGLMKGFSSKHAPMDYNRCEADCLKLDSCLGYSNLEFKEGDETVSWEYACGLYVTGYNASFRKTKDFLRLTVHLGYNSGNIHASEVAGLGKGGGMGDGMNYWSHHKSPVLEIMGVNTSYLPLLETQLQANSNSLQLPKCMLKKVKAACEFYTSSSTCPAGFGCEWNGIKCVGAWAYRTYAPPTPAPPTPPPERICFYESDFVTVKKDAKALDGTTWSGFHAPFQVQEEGPIRNACGRVAKRICNDDALHLKEGETRYFREAEKYDRTSDDAYYSANQKESKLGFVTHRDGRFVGQEWYGQGPNYGQETGILSGNKPEALGEDGNPRRRVSLWGYDRRRQPKLYGAQWEAKHYYTPDYVLVYFENGYVNSYRWRDLELCEDYQCKVGDEVEAVWYCCNQAARDGKGRCTERFPATISEINDDGTFTVTWSAEANRSFAARGGSHCNPGFNWDKSYSEDAHDGLISHTEEARRRRKPMEDEAGEIKKVSDRIILAGDVFKYSGDGTPPRRRRPTADGKFDYSGQSVQDETADAAGLYRIPYACTKQAGTHPEKHYPTLAPPTPAPPTPIPEAIFNKMAARVAERADNKEKRTEARVKSAKDNEKRRRDKANGCASFCAKNDKGWKTACSWKSCYACDRCERERMYARKWALKEADGCADWCATNLAPWKSKCSYEMCGKCSECKKVKSSNDRRLLLI